MKLYHSLLDRCISREPRLQTRHDVDTKPELGCGCEICWLIDCLCPPECMHWMLWIHCKQIASDAAVSSAFRNDEMCDCIVRGCLSEQQKCISVLCMGHGTNVPIHKGCVEWCTPARIIAILAEWAISKLWKVFDMLTMDAAKTKHDFIKSRATMSNLLETTSFIANAMEHKSQVDIIIYSDFVKA